MLRRIMHKISSKIEKHEKVDILIQRSNDNYNNKKWLKAIKYYKVIIERNNASEELFAKYAVSLRMTKRYMESESIISEGLIVYPASIWLKVELACLKMNEGKWREAIVLWMELYNTQSGKMSANNINRILKVYEELESWSEYKTFSSEAIKRFPKDVNIQSRSMLAKSLYLAEQGRFEESVRNLTSKKIRQATAWPIKNTLLHKLIDEYTSKSELKSLKDSNNQYYFLSSRNDGLGERLNAMITGVFLAKRFGYNFGFHWIDSLTDATIKNGCQVNGVIGHAIDDATSIFSSEFINKYRVKDLNELSNRSDFYGEHVDHDYLELQGLSQNILGFNAPRIDLKGTIHPDLEPREKFSYKNAFEEISFSDGITEAIKKASVVNMENTVAIHLRSGDVFYGEYRKYIHYTYKGITIPIAKAIIEKELLSGKNIIVFGQDDEVLNYLSNNYDITLAKNLIPTNLTDNTQVAFFEIKLMSMCTKICAGSSGFAKIASWIGNIPLDASTSYFSVTEQNSISRKDLECHENDYNSYQTAFAYWHTYYFGRAGKEYLDSIVLLEKAFYFDPDNELYPIIIAILAVCNNDEKKFSEMTCLIFDDLKSEPKPSYFKVMSSKTLNDLNLIEYYNKLLAEDFLFMNEALANFTLIVSGLCNDNERKSEMLTIINDNNYRMVYNEKYLVV